MMILTMILMILKTLVLMINKFDFKKYTNTNGAFASAQGALKEAHGESYLRTRTKWSKMSSSPNKNMAAKVSRVNICGTPSRFSVWIPKLLPSNFNDILPWKIVATWG